MKSILLAAALTLGLAAPAGATPEAACAPADRLIARLKENHFALHSKKTDAKSGITYRLMTTRNGAWVILSVSPDGRFICVLDAGTGYDPGLEV